MKLSGFAAKECVIIFQHLYTTVSYRDPAEKLTTHEESVVPIRMCGDEEVEDRATDVAGCACCEYLGDSHAGCGGRR